MSCRIINELNQEECRAERADKEWIALCPAMRDTAAEIAAGILRDGRRHRLFLPAFEDGWLNVSDEAEALLVRCLAAWRLKLPVDEVTQGHLADIAEAALNAVIKDLYGSTENTWTLCADGYSEKNFITDLVRR